PRNQSFARLRLLRAAHRAANRTGSCRVPHIGGPIVTHPRVLLVDMPFASIHLPSLALGLLKAELAHAAVQADVLYLNVLFAQMVGWSAYGVVERASAVLAGEQMFAHDLFDAQIPSDRRYESEVLAHLEPRVQHDLRHLKAHVSSFLGNCMERIS